MHSIGGASRPTSAHRVLGLVTVMTLFITAALSFIAPAAQAADDVAITNGTVTWGVKQSWRNYVGEAGITATGGVTRATNGAFNWPVESGSYSPATKKLDLQLKGVVHFTAHEGELDMTIKNPRLVIDGDEPQLFADVVSKSESTGEMIDYGVIPLVNLDLESGSPDTVDGVTTWTPLDTTLTADGYEAFSRNYGVGVAMDPVSAVYTGPGGKPSVTAETWDVPGSLGFEQLPTIRTQTPTTSPSTTPDLPRTFAILPDKARNVLHIATNLGIDTYTLDGQTRLGSAALNLIDSYPAPILDPATGDVLVNGNRQVRAVTWHADTATHSVAQIYNAAVTQMVADPVGRRVLATALAGVISFTHADGAWSRSTYAERFVHPRPALTVDADGTVIMVAGGVPQVLTLAGGTATMSPLPGNYTDTGPYGPVYPSEIHAVPDGLLISNTNGTVYRAAKTPTGYAAPGEPQRTGLGQVLRSTYDSSTGSLYLADLALGRVVAVRGDRTGTIAVKDLGFYVTVPIGMTVLDGTLLVSANFFGGSGEDYGIRRFRPTGIVPEVTGQPADRTVTLGVGDTSAAAAFEIQTSGEGVKIQWQSRPATVGKFADINGETSKHLTLTARAVDQGRQVRAVVTNAAGKISTDVATLSVLTAPSAIIDLTDKTVEEGKDAVFEVMPAGNPYPSITWQRRIGGYWTNVDHDDDNFTVDGGKLTVRATNLDQSGGLFRAKLSNSVATVHTRTGTLTVAAQSDSERAIESGQLNWGVKKSFRDYVVGNIAHGQITVSDGATKNADGTFAFTVDSGTWDPKAKKVSVDYEGTVRFTGHNGDLSLTITDPELDATGNKGVLTADVTSKDMATGETKDYGRVAVADVDATDAISAAGTTLTVKDAAATLTAAGAPAFAGFYAAGAALDALGSDLALGKEVGSDVPSRTEVIAAKASYAYGASTSATVTVTAPNLVPTGTVRVTVAGKKLTGTLNSGKATVALPKGLTPGSYPVTAAYAGIDGISGSSSVATVKVTKATPNISTKLAKSTIKKSQRAKLRITTSLPGATSGLYPTGQLIVRDGGKIIAVKTLKPSAKGKVTVTLPKLPKGKHFVKVTLTGNSLQTTKSTGYRVLRVK